MDSYTNRGLILPGGGQRGYLHVLFLERFIKQCGLEKPLHNYFDVIAGTSIGAINACALAYGVELSTMRELFEEVGQWIFTIRSAWDIHAHNPDATSPSNKPNWIQKLSMISSNEPFYQSFYDGANYGSARLYREIRSIFGEARLSDLKTHIVIPTYDMTSGKYKIFSNYKNTIFSSNDEKIADICLASAAAPIYLPSYNIATNGIKHSYEDGGIYMNDPSMPAYFLGRKIKPFAERSCFLTVTTGVGSHVFDKEFTYTKINNLIELINKEVNLIEDNKSDLNHKIYDEDLHNVNDLAKQKKVTIKEIGEELSVLKRSIIDILDLLNVSMTGSQESADFNMNLLNTVPMSQHYYYRFAPKLSSDISTDLDDTSDEVMKYYRKLVDDIYMEQERNISDFISHFRV